MKNKELYKLLKKNKSNSGFTLTELLVGLFMSIFVIGALGFGLMTVLATSQSETSKVKARTENSRALDFVSDEVRRARKIENFANSTNAPNFTTTAKTVVLALDIPLISDSATLDTDSDATTKTERVVYYLKSTGLGNWKGPQVLYRWGPPLNANGEYTAGTWTEQALIDGINSTPIATSELDTSCPTATRTLTPAAPTGFYACLFRQDATKAYQPNETLPNYNPYNTSQLFLTGQTKTASGRYDDTQTNDSQVVARARKALAYKTDLNNSVTWSVKGLGGAYECNRNTTPPPTWNMRTDFGNDSANPDNTTKWIQEQDRNKQPQPIEIDASKDLTITSSAIGSRTDCNSRGNSGANGSELLSSYPTNLKISHTVDFNNPITFNGDKDISSGGTAYDTPQVVTNQTIQFLKKGPVPLYGGYDGVDYDANNDGTITTGEGDQPSLGKFLYDKKMAIIDPTNTTTGTEAQILNNPLTKFLIPTAAQLEASTSPNKSAFILLGDDQRIVGVEVGQTSTKLADGTTNNPGFDLQDNIFVVTSDVFKTKFKPSCFSGGNCNPSTGEPNP